MNWSSESTPVLAVTRIENRPRSTMHPTTNEELTIWLHKVIIPVLCVLGIVGNVLNILVLTRGRMRHTVAEKQEKMVLCVGFVALASSDLLVCVFFLPRAVIPEHQVAFQQRSFSLYYQVYSTGLVTTCQLISTWLIVVMAAVRYLGICHPLRARSCPWWRAFYRTVVAVCILAILLNLPSFWLYTVHSVTLPGAGKSTLIIDLGPCSHYSHYGLVFLWARAVLAVFLPVPLLLYFNLRLILALRASDRLRRHHARRNISHRARLGPRRGASQTPLTVSLIAVIVVFIALVFPCEIMDFIGLVFPAVTKPDPETFLLARSMANILQVTNFALNFVIYCALNNQFRKAALHMLCSWRQRSQPGASIGTVARCCRADMTRLPSTSSHPQIFSRPRQMYLTSSHAARSHGNRSHDNNILQCTSFEPSSYIWLKR